MRSFDLRAALLRALLWRFAESLQLHSWWSVQHLHFCIFCFRTFHTCVFSHSLLQLWRVSFHVCSSVLLSLCKPLDRISRIHSHQKLFNHWLLVIQDLEWSLILMHRTPLGCLDEPLHSIYVTLVSMHIIVKLFCVEPFLSRRWLWYF